MIACEMRIDLKSWCNQWDQEPLHACEETVPEEKKTEKVKALKKKEEKEKKLFSHRKLVFSLRTFLYLSLKITAVSSNASAQTRGLGFGGLRRDGNCGCF